MDSQNSIENNSTISKIVLRFDNSSSEDEITPEKKELFDTKSAETFENQTKNNLKYKFEKRICKRAVLDNKTNKCIGCKYDVSDHAEVLINEVKWDSDKCTDPAPTDANGRVRFPGSHRKISSYIKVAKQTPIERMVQFLYDKNGGWNLSMPQLIISVTGGAQNFTIPHRMKTAFKRGLVKAATSTNAWIITGGTNTGVMRLVGEAVSDHFYKGPVIGIATWSKIALKDKLIKNDQNQNPILYVFDDDESSEKAEDTLKQVNNIRKEEKQVLLDPNHTHFILVDDGSTGSYGVEISFRVELEKELSKGLSISHYENKMKFGERKSAMRLASVVEQGEISEAEPSEKKKLEWSNSVTQDTDESNEKVIPIIMIVVQGGPNTLETVYKALKQNIPVILYAGTKGCADLLTNALSLSNQNINSTEFDEKLMNLIYESKIITEQKKSKDKNEEKNKADRLKTVLNNVKAILDNKDKHLINVFELDNGDGSSDMELTILRAFLNSNQRSYYENLKLALKWNRIDIAKSEILTGEDAFKNDELNTLMELALIEDRPEFVEILLENRINLYSFLTYKRLYFLYNSDKIKQSSKKSPLYQLGYNESSTTFEKIKRFLKKYCIHSIEFNFLPEESANPKEETRILKNVMQLANYHDTADYNTENENSEFNKPVPYAIQNLFIWAVLHNRIELAKIFWLIGQYQVCNALFASALFRNLAWYLSDYEKELLNKAKYFENLAVGVFNIFDENTDNLINGVILLRTVPYYGIDTLEMAVEADCKKFVSQASVQKLLTDIWYGRVLKAADMKMNFKFMISCLTFGLLAPFLLYNEKDSTNTLTDLDLELQDYAINNEIKIKKRIRNFINNHKLKKKSNKKGKRDSLVLRMFNDIEASKRNCGFCAWYQQGFTIFFNAARTRFTYHTISYLIFLLLYSYIMLCDFDYHDQNILDSSLLSYRTNTTSLETKLKSPTLLQYVLTVWVFTIFCDEVRQFITGSLELGSLKLKLLEYLKDNWNYLDILGVLLFAIGMSFRFIAFFLAEENLFEISRLLLCIDLSIWYIRLLHVSLVFKSLGPKLVMIRQMLRDLIFFVTIIAIFVCCFGITTQAILYNQNKIDFELFYNIIHKGYWPIYGEMKILEDDIEKFKTCNSTNSDNCPRRMGAIFSLIALIVYMVIANILLLNLLIAMFSSTFQKLENNTDEIWKFQRYKLVFEYFDTPVLPPPFIIFSHVFQILKVILKKIKRICTCKVDKTFTQVQQFEDASDPLLDCEKQFSELHLRHEKETLNTQVDSRLQINSEKLETLEEKLNGLISTHDKDIRQMHQSIKKILNILENNSE